MDFLELLKSGNIKDAYSMMKAKENVESHVSEYNNKRDLRDTQVGNRKDKATKNEIVKVTKTPIPFQRQIVRTATTFLFGSPVKLVEKKEAEAEDDTSEAFNELRNLWDDLRMDQTLLKFCKSVKLSTEAAIVFYAQKKEGEDTKVKCRLINHENGKLLPVFDAFGDMIAFGWEYKVKENDKDVSYLYVWTAENRYIFKKTSGDWQPNDTEPKMPNLFKKIPVVYLSQNNPEWWEVQDLIDNFEMTFSKFVDTNGYFASPMYKVKGAVKSIPKKDETGKMVQLDILETDKGNIIEADLDVISWDRAPEALKLEFETEKGLIYGLTDTPDLSFDNVKGIGNVSGIALKLMFLGPILKAKEAEGDYQTVISRIINVMKAGLSNISNTSLKSKLEELRIESRFTSVLPENIKEIIEMLSEATGGKAIMSQETAVKHNPLIDDNEQEMDNLEKEQVSSLGESEL